MLATQKKYLIRSLIFLLSILLTPESKGHKFVLPSVDTLISSDCRKKDHDDVKSVYKNSEFLRSLHQAVNQYRQKHKLKTLTVSTNLVSIAKSHTREMSQHDYLSHVNRDKKSTMQRLEESGFTYIAAGENLAMGFKEATRVVEAWEKSPEHKKVLDDPSYTHLGIAVHGPKDHVTALFALPQCFDGVALRRYR